MSNRLQQSLDYIEVHLDAPLTLDEVASAAHLSSYHFARLFRATLGRSPMEYVRLRRLSEAVLLLRRDAAISITDLAMQAGFESHQGFTTAFKREFHIAPALYRERPFALPLQEKIVMSAHKPKIPAGPDYRSHPALTVAGLMMHCTEANKIEIPQLWGEFVPWLGNIPGQLEEYTYGVCLPLGDGNINYVAGVAVAPNSQVPDALTTVSVPAGRYAVFTHQGSLDFLQDTVGYIFGTWAPQSGKMLQGQPDFERYDERFDPVTSSGEMEYWVPVKADA